LFDFSEPSVAEWIRRSAPRLRLGDERPQGSVVAAKYARSVEMDSGFRRNDEE
jgi:hypothetical protein